MSLTCVCDYDGDGWWWSDPVETTLKSKRSRRCCSCGSKVRPGDTVVDFSRSRMPRSDIEERIYDEEVPLTSWYMCEECGDLFWSLHDLGFCIYLGQETMRELAREYGEMTRERLASLNAKQDAA